jgi:uncharacterized protein
MPLLAVKPTESGFEGSTAELILEVKEGTGRVFVDTFPLSKIDTQISMRFAKETACDFLDENCDKYDFIYTIRAGSPIIGGPSAGAPATILTVSVLSKKPFEEDISLTGTINSGGLIGPVGGLKEKISAGAKFGLNTILIPEGELLQINDSINNTINLSEYASELNINLIEVSNIDEALQYFIGDDFKQVEEDIMISESYKDTMKILASELCERNTELKDMLGYREPESKAIEIYDEAINLSKRGENAYNLEQYYSSASYCFGSNVKLNQVFLETKNFSTEKYNGLFEELRKSIIKFDNELDKKNIRTITDLESYMVVKERLIEALDYTNITGNSSFTYAYAYANERLRSAYSWYKFFGHDSKVLELNEDSLRESCRQRIAEAEERIQYASIYLP